jgi:hypothetical protein
MLIKNGIEVRPDMKFVLIISHDDHIVSRKNRRKSLDCLLEQRTAGMKL